MKYMIIERYRPGRVKEIYERFDVKGRMMPEGVNCIGSWSNTDVTVWYQLMESDSEEKLQEWIRCWSDLVDFEIVPVISSATARGKVFTK